MNRRILLTLVVVVASACGDEIEDDIQLSSFISDEEGVPGVGACRIDETTFPDTWQWRVVLSLRQEWNHWIRGEKRNRALLHWWSTSQVKLKNSVKIMCAEGTKFEHNSTLHDFNEFICLKWPKATAKRSDAKCFNESIIVDVGFKLDDRFLKVYSVCYNEEAERSYFTRNKLRPSSDAQEKSVERPHWDQADFYPGKHLNTLYARSKQRKAIADILGSETLAKEYVKDPNSDVYLTKGHLAARTDFFFANEQRATFFFINAMPQYQRFNSINWLALGMSSRERSARWNCLTSLDSPTKYFSTPKTTKFLFQCSSSRFLWIHSISRESFSLASITFISLKSQTTSWSAQMSAIRLNILRGTGINWNMGTAMLAKSTTFWRKRNSSRGLKLLHCCCRNDSFWNCCWALRERPHITNTFFDYVDHFEPHPFFERNAISNMWTLDVAWWWI